MDNDNLTKKREHIINQLKSSIDKGGSGSVYHIEIDKKEFCLKMINKENMYKKLEHIKLLEELYYILKCQCPFIIPVIDLEGKKVNNYNKINEFKEFIDKLKTLPEGDIKDNFFKTLKEEIDSQFGNILFIQDVESSKFNIGYIMERGCELENLLICYSKMILHYGFKDPHDNFPYDEEIITNDPDINKVPDKFRSFFSKQVDREKEKLKKFIKEKLLNKLIKDILSALKHLHSKNITHMDVKERNILVFIEDGDLKFVLFDFGCSKEVEDNGLPKDAEMNAEFQSSYLYLPIQLQSLKSLSKFTNHNKVSYTFKDLKDSNPNLNTYILDLHAFSRVIKNIIVDSRFRRLTASFEDDFEWYYSFAQILSFNFIKEDEDSIYKSDVNKNKLSNKTFEIFDKANEIQIQAQTIFDSNDFKAFIEKCFKSDESPDLTFNIPEVYGKKYDLNLLLKSKLMLKLEEIKQLGYKYISAPRSILHENYAMHRRYHHSLGVCNITYLFIISLLRNSGWFRLRLKSDDFLYLLITALIHDIGHYPSTHDLESMIIFPSQSELFNSILGLNDNNLKAIVGSNQGEYLELRNNIDSLLVKYDLKFKDFKTWLEIFLSVKKEKTDNGNKLKFRSFVSIITSPVDADKIQYLGFDGKNCNISLTNCLFSEKCSTNDLFDFFKNIKIPIRNRSEYCEYQRYCLGINEDNAHLARMILFLRAEMFGKIYWAEEARAVVTMLKYILSKLFDIMIKKKEQKEITDFIHKWITGNDNDALKLLKDKILIYENKEKSDIKISNIYDYLFDEQKKCIYNEIARIYPNDKVTYKNILKHVGIREENILYTKKITMIADDLYTRIQEILMQVLNLPKGKIKMGSFLIDLPSLKETEKKHEFSRFSLVDKFGYGRGVGKIWDDIEDHFINDFTIIRIYIHPSLMVYNREDRMSVRHQILKEFS